MKVILKVNLYRKVCVIFSCLRYHICPIASTFKLLPSPFFLSIAISLNTIYNSIIS